MFKRVFIGKHPVHMIGKHHTDETKKKISDALKIKFGTSEMREKFSRLNSGENNPMYGRKHTEESIRKNREAHLGERNPMYGVRRTGKNNPNYGKGKFKS